jgi:hypothetical protein
MMRRMDEAEKQDVELAESEKIPAEAPQALKQSIRFVTALIHSSSMLPSLKPRQAGFLDAVLHCLQPN